MRFKNLTHEQQEALSQEVLDIAMAMGGKNIFLQMIEDIKESKEHPLTNKKQFFHYTYGKIEWNKFIYKATFDALLRLIRTQEKEGDIFHALSDKERKKALNTLKTLSPIEITITPQEGSAFGCRIIERTTPNTTHISLLFKVLFFYNIDFVKKIVNGTI